jgi:hypothetical protein
MQYQANRVRSEVDRRAERAVVLRILGNDNEESCSRRELEDDLEYFGRPAVDGAVARLENDGIINLQDGLVSVS